MVWLDAGWVASASWLAAMHRVVRGSERGGVASERFVLNLFYGWRVIRVFD